MPVTPEQVEHAGKGRLSPARPIRILIAEADADERARYRDAFELAGCEVTEAADGRDAMAKAFLLAPSLVITELTLPFVNGYALCDILRRDPLTADVPILVVTGAPLSEPAEQIEVDAVLLKPATPARLVTEAQRLLATSRDVQARSAASRRQPATQQPHAADLQRSSPSQRRIVRTKAHQRFTTTSPPLPAPALSCPSCDRALKYEHSHIGGVSDRYPEQWDYFICPTGCGVFQYRQRTRRVRHMD